MKVIDPGHVYRLDTLDGIPFEEARLLVFVKREGKGYPGNVGHHAGTNLQEVLRACIHRLQYLDRQIPDYHNLNAINYLRSAILSLEERAANRHGRSPIELKGVKIEELAVCPKCLHIGCLGLCH